MAARGKWRREDGGWEYMRVEKMAAGEYGDIKDDGGKMSPPGFHTSFIRFYDSLNAAAIRDTKKNPISRKIR